MNFQPTFSTGIFQFEVVFAIRVHIVSFFEKSSNFKSNSTILKILQSTLNFVSINQFLQSASFQRNFSFLHSGFIAAS